MSDGYPIGMVVFSKVGMLKKNDELEIIGEVRAVILSAPERRTVNAVYYQKNGAQKKGEETYSPYGQSIRAIEDGPIPGVSLKGKTGFTHLAWMRPA